MTHNLTVTVEDDLWKEMKKHEEIRWSAVMKEAARQKLKAISLLDKLARKTTLSEREIEDFALKLGKKVSGRR